MTIEFVDQIWWYSSRAAGIVAWVLLSVSVIAGLTISTRATGIPTQWKVDLHRFFSTLSLTFLAVHMATLVPDNFVYFAWAEIFVPFASEWQPGAVAWGIVAFWLLVAVEVSSLLRARIRHGLWKAIHFSSFAVWTAATIHLFTAGTDVGHPVFRVAQAVVISAVVVMTIYRVWVQTKRRAGKKRREDESGEPEQPDAVESAGGGPLPIEEPVHVDQVYAGERREFSSRWR